MMKIIKTEGAINIMVFDGYVYDIPLSRMQTPAAVLDWVHQICVGKNWGRDNAALILDVIFDAIPSDMWSGKG